jgi:hypothetical protein
MANISKTTSCDSAETWLEMAMHFADEIFLSYSAGFLNMPQNLMTWGRRLYFPLKKVILWISNALINL